MFLIVLVDVLGFTIVIPLLSLYAEKFGATPLVATLIVSCYAVSSLISTPIIGKLSDTHGRRKLLLVSQAGTCAGFLILATSTSLWMVFVGRILDGLTAGNLSLAQAYISDHTKPENRAKAFAVIGIAFGIGFMFGPLLGGFLGQYGMHYPFIAAAGLSALSIFCTYTLLPKKEEKPETAAEVVGPGGRRPSAFDVATYTEYFGRPALRSLYLQFFLFTYAFSAFISGFALYAERRFVTSAGTAWTATEVGYLFAYSGFIGILWQGGAIGRLVKKFGEVKLTVAGFVASIIGYVVFALIPNDKIMPIALLTIVSSFGHGVLRPVLTSRITQAVGRHEQGIAIGISGSLSSLAMMMAPPTGGFLLDHGWLFGWPMVPAVMSLFGLAVAIATRARTPASSPPSPGLSSAP
jgi:DHA1 family tetracycline resistance protein-like MFS transporter